MAKVKLKPWSETRSEILANPEDAAAYLDTVLEDNDPEMFLLALRQVVQAQGGMRKVAQLTKLNRANLYRMLSKDGRPEIQTVTRLLKSFGLRLAIAAEKSSKRSPHALRLWKPA